LVADAESNLPVCCHRDGKHHCMGHMPAELQKGTSLRAADNRCPGFPKIATAFFRSLGTVDGTDRMQDRRPVPEVPRLQYQSRCFTMSGAELTKALPDCQGTEA
jgi:hypothetical protein